MNFDDLKKLDYVYIADREASLLFFSLFMLSDKKVFTDFVLEDIGKLYTDNTVFVAKGMIVSMFRDKKSVAESAELMKKRFTEDPNRLKELKDVSLIQAKEVEKDILEVKKKLDTNQYNPSDIYQELRNIFINFFGVQVFPLIIERAFEQLSVGDLGNFKEVLIQWREGTHEIQSELEETFDEFLDKENERFGVNLRYYSDAEIQEVFNGSLGVSSEIINQRQSGYLMTWNWDKKIPYSVFVSSEIVDFVSFLNNKRNVDTNKISFKGRVVNGGTVTGKVYLIHEKKDFTRIPPESIVIAKVVELDDFSHLSVSERAAIVTEEGGITSHLAIRGRELGIPVIAGAKGIYNSVKDSDMVEVDADNGIVRIIK
ncbi:MAG TPA: PEP-utilizing enzyme [Candidatus Paceibacterota bacterium]|nr:PEP-utilizing enzyme [Candidatus Paceibacterota bacterium]